MGGTSCNSTTRNPLITKAITVKRWKGGITNEKKYFSENRGEKVLTTVKYYCSKVSTPIGVGNVSHYYRRYEGLRPLLSVCD